MAIEAQFPALGFLARGCVINPLQTAVTATETNGSQEHFGCVANSSSRHTLNRAKFPSRGCVTNLLRIAVTA